MPLPITIADDSRLSRKMIIRALPSDWDVDINQAENGEQAVAACRDGKADVLFLDLTMPVMDGYQALEQIQKEQLNSLVFVISSDIQPEAVKRVKKLGAATFISKPVTPDDIKGVLHDYGLI